MTLVESGRFPAQLPNYALGNVSPAVRGHYALLGDAVKEGRIELATGPAANDDECSGSTSLAFQA